MYVCFTMLNIHTYEWVWAIKFESYYGFHTSRCQCHLHTIVVLDFPFPDWLIQKFTIKTIFQYYLLSQSFTYVLYHKYCTITFKVPKLFENIRRSFVHTTWNTFLTHITFFTFWHFYIDYTIRILYLLSAIIHQSVWLRRNFFSILISVS